MSNDTRSKSQRSSMAREMNERVMLSRVGCSAGQALRLHQHGRVAWLGSRHKINPSFCIPLRYIISLKNLS